MKILTKPISRKAEIVIQELEKEVLIYDLRRNKAFCLNETSALIWQMCDGGKLSVQEISLDVSRKLKTPVSEDLIWLAIEQLKKENLIENSSELPDKFEGMNRRDVIRRIGLASFAALPVISTIVAPMSVQAASRCIQPGQLPGSGLSGQGCNNTNAGCDAIYGSRCCSGNAVTQFVPCPDSPGTPYRCICGN